MVDLEDEEGDEFRKQPRWRAREFGTALGQREFAFEVAPQAQGDEKLVQYLERREFVLVNDLAVAEHLLGGLFGPGEVLDSPMHKDALERHGLGQTFRPVRLRILKRQQRNPQQRRACQVRMVIGRGAEHDYGLMLPKELQSGQTQIAEGCGT